MQPLDLRAHQHPQLGVQVRQRLVQQVGAGIAHDRAAEGHSLPLATGQLARLAIQQVFDVERPGRLQHLLVDRCLWHPHHLQREPDVLPDGLVRVERVALEHHRHIAFVRRQPTDRFPVEEHVAAGRSLQPADHPQRGRLPAAGRPDQRQELLVADRQVQIVHDRLAAEGLRHVLESYFCHRLSPSQIRRPSPAPACAGRGAPVRAAGRPRAHRPRPSP